MNRIVKNKNELVYSSLDRKTELDMNEYLADLGLKYDIKMNGTIYGEYKNYPLIIHGPMSPKNLSYMYMLEIPLLPFESLSYKDLAKKLKKSNKSIKNVSFNDSSLEVYMKLSGMKTKKILQNLDEPLDAVVAILDYHNLKPAV